MSDESALDPPLDPAPAGPVAVEPAVESTGLRPRLFGGLSLPRVQAVFGLIAALVSISGGVYGYVRPRPVAHAGDLVAVVQDARSGRAVPDALVEVLTPRDALVTTLEATDGEARSPMKEGPYRLRVTHPRFAPEVRQIQVIAGQTTEVRVRLAPRSAKALR